MTNATGENSNSTGATPTTTDPVVGDAAIGADSINGVLSNDALQLDASFQVGGGHDPMIDAMHAEEDGQQGDDLDQDDRKSIGESTLSSQFTHPAANAWTRTDEEDVGLHDE
jgi:hypothetical protein